MYQAHFGLDRPLFDAGIAQDAAVYRSPKHEPLFAQLRLALAAPDAVVALTGPAGVGKTTFASAALRASHTRLALAWLNGTPTNASELLELLLTELGCNAQRTTRIERLQMWRQFLSEASATDSRVFVVVERTEDLAPELLRALDALTSSDATGAAGVNVLLLGQPSLDQYLASPRLDSLRQRIRLRLRLAAFDAADTERYLRLHVERAGGRLEQLFADGALAAVQRYSGGVARVINNLCETALTLAASEGLRQLTPEIVATTAVGWLGIEDTTPVAKPEPKHPVSAASVEAAPTAPAPAPALAPEQRETAPTAAPATAAPTAIIATPPAAAVPVPTAPPPAPPEPTPVVVAPAPAALAPVVPAASTPPAHVVAPSPPRVAAQDEPTLTDTDFDAVSTDVPVVADIDFPVLTDAVEPEDFEAAVAAATAHDVAAVAPPAAPAPTVRASAPPPAATNATVAAPKAGASNVTPPPRIERAPAATRIETAYATPKPAPAAAKPAASSPVAAAAPTKQQPVAPRAPEPEEDSLRQTQTMRAIGDAKSIDDISSSMAETLFGDADLEMLSQALASAGFGDGEAQHTPSPIANAPAPEPKARTRPIPPPQAREDDLLDLLGLGADAPLELLDDSPAPQDEGARKLATRR